MPEKEEKYTFILNAQLKLDILQTKKSAGLWFESFLDVRNM